MHGSWFFMLPLSLHTKRQVRSSTPYIQYHGAKMVTRLTSAIPPYYILAIPHYYILPPKLTPYKNRTGTRYLLYTAWMRDGTRRHIIVIGRCCSRSHHDGHARLFLLQGLPLKAPSAEGNICLLATGLSSSLWLPQRCLQKAFQLQEGCKATVSVQRSLKALIMWEYTYSLLKQRFQATCYLLK